MIKEKEYLKAKKIVKDYESKQLNKHAVSGRSEQLCFCGQKLEIKVGDNRAWRECNNGHEQ